MVAEGEGGSHGSPTPNHQGGTGFGLPRILGDGQSGSYATEQTFNDAGPKSTSRTCRSTKHRLRSDLLEARFLTLRSTYLADPYCIRVRNPTLPDYTIHHDDCLPWNCQNFWQVFLSVPFYSTMRG
jgi:hypothetical protein